MPESKIKQIRKMLNREPTPESRTEQIEKMLFEYFGSPEDTNIVDILADIQHYCKIKKIDFLSELETATNHFEIEITET
jgi:uncharacterized protein (DUF488 family)